MSLIFIPMVACFKCGLEFTEEKLAWSSNGKGRICPDCKNRESNNKVLWGYPVSKELDRPRGSSSTPWAPKG